MLLVEGRILNNLAYSSKCFCGVSEWRKIKERGFGCFGSGKSGVKATGGKRREGSTCRQTRDFEKPVRHWHGLWLSQFKKSGILLEAFSFTGFKTSGYTSECFTGVLAVACKYYFDQIFALPNIWYSRQREFICFSIVLNDCMVCSAKPSEARWNGALVTWLMLFLEQNLANNCSLVKEEVLSETIVSWSPWVANMGCRSSIVDSYEAVWVIATLTHSDIEFTK